MNQVRKLTLLGLFVFGFIALMMLVIFWLAREVNVTVTNATNGSIRLNNCVDDAADIDVGQAIRLTIMDRGETGCEVHDSGGYIGCLVMNTNISDKRYVLPRDIRVDIGKSHCDAI